MNIEEQQQSVDLVEKHRPQQKRAIRTYEGILDAAAELLVELGLERISTNLIAERAGITVPALYRYFPNKYSVLNAMGGRLLELQNQAFVEWNDQNVVGVEPQSIVDNIYDVLAGCYEVTVNMTGGVQIMHALQAIAPLQQVRQDNHWLVAETFAKVWAAQFNVAMDANSVQRARVAIELGFATVQMAIEDDRSDAELVLREGASALSLYLKGALERKGLNLT
ncbi:TetR/AcrR family transcriptional regulator [Halieaceae bacterium IMCC14734]|uniref:TetR/AcrR family transcriptional regulator n=1 Tax=Candidatus Litorirhabdus singularis TaxID=2518993 RepID=A0ABT3TH45_9GAMM|nr:TetR/AcrR family transcriptional regulator [Candidatus Litorirhabdus singularis]MCX2981525.1 TetR/AcrR family transcriptional regulator [Candidatus Litorirhabdus singularis]